MNGIIRTVNDFFHLARVIVDKNTIFLLCKSGQAYPCLYQPYRVSPHYFGSFPLTVSVSFRLPGRFGVAPEGCFPGGLVIPAGLCTPMGNFGALAFGFVIAGVVESGVGRGAAGVVTGGLEVVIAGLE